MKTKSSSVIETCLQTAYPSDSEWRFICSQINQADPVALKLNNLILNGTIPKDRIFYRYLSDVLEMYLNPDHKYYPDVIEFFSTIMYLGGRRTFNLFEGPCAMVKVVDFGISKMSVRVK